MAILLNLCSLNIAHFRFSLGKLSFGVSYRIRTSYLSLGFIASAHGCASFHHGWKMELLRITYAINLMPTGFYSWVFLQLSILKLISRFAQTSDVAAGLSYLHENTVIHGDLRGVNIDFVVYHRRFH